MFYKNMKGPKPKGWICNVFVKLAFSVSEALKNTQINAFKRYIIQMLFKIHFALGSHISIDLKIVANSTFWPWTGLFIYTRTST